jgi:elongation factor P
MISTNEFRKGVKLQHNGQPYTIVEFQHVSPGKGSAFVRTRIKNLKTGQVLELNYKSGEMVEEPDLEFKEMQYLYNDGESYTFMDNGNYDQVQLSKEELGDNIYYIMENSVFKVTFFEGKPVAVEVPVFIELAIVETQPNIKGDTASGGGKPAKLSTGLTVNVPFHLSEGDVIKVDTRTSSYVEKVNKK